MIFGYTSAASQNSNFLNAVSLSTGELQVSLGTGLTVQGTVKTKSKYRDVASHSTGILY
ncbi:hypothetical protein KO164_0010 [Thalassospira sp. KO164]|nr:hypothetical protein KO164_0010 [Thalassospira sp. KO164]SEC84973.1 hypothetical protein SAMN04515623_0009 [Thalassospira permensis]